MDETELMFDSSQTVELTLEADRTAQSARKAILGLWTLRERLPINLPNRQFAHINFHADRSAQFTFPSSLLGISGDIALAFWFSMATQTILFVKEREENPHAVSAIYLTDHRFLISLGRGLAEFLHVFRLKRVGFIVSIANEVLRRGLF